jgi:hypothetical protein
MGIPTAFVRDLWLSSCRSREKTLPMDGKGVWSNNWLLTAE